MKSQPKKKNRFMAFLSSLCSAKPSNDQNEQKDKKKSKLKVQKVPRLTFQLDRVLVKLSRKNIAQEQIMENQVLTYQLEKYLASRLKDCDIVIFSGEFSNFLIQKIPLSIQLKSKKQQAFQNQNNYILSNQQGKINIRFEAIGALVFQLYFGENQNSSNKCEKSDKPEEKQQPQQVNHQIDKIEEILKFYQKKINNFVFICHKNMKLEEIHGLFLVFREKYMFQFERVKKIQKTVCNVIYVSAKANFLRFDNLSLCDFIITQFQKMKGFEDETGRNKDQETLKFKELNIQNENNEKSTIQVSKKQLTKEMPKQQIFILKELSKRQFFRQLVLKMLEKNLHLQVSQALATIFQFHQKKSYKTAFFLELMYERYPDCREIVEKYRLMVAQNREQEFTKSFSEFTPIFAHKQNNFSKITVLFRTHSSREDDDFIFCKEQENYDTEF